MDRYKNNITYLCDEVEKECYKLKAITLLEGKFCTGCIHYGGRHVCHAEYFEDCLPVRHNLDSLEAYLYGILKR